MMIGAFKFNDIESSVFDLVCQSVRRPLLPAVKQQRVELSNSSGVYDFNNSEYGLRQVAMKVMYIGKDYYELRSRARQIAAWLGTDDWTRLIIHDEPDLYYSAKITSESELQSMWEAGVAEVVFDCQPFAYSLVEESKKFKPSNGTVYNFTNPGTRAINYKSPPGSKFNVVVTGSWNTLTLKMNDKTLTYKTSGSGTLVLDSLAMDVLLNGANRFDSIDGDIDEFFQINPGDNTLTVTGSGLDINMSVDYIPMWY